VDIETIKNLEIDCSKLVLAREEKGMTQSEVAKELGLDRRVVWQYENGKALPLENFTKLMFFYGKPIEFFLKTV
jgi:transcriptional regulator with XRE-family HTH domain